MPDDTTTRWTVSVSRDTDALRSVSCGKKLGIDRTQASSVYTSRSHRSPPGKRVGQDRRRANRSVLPSLFAHRVGLFSTGAMRTLGRPHVDSWKCEDQKQASRSTYPVDSRKEELIETL